jgi:hypothetical protein
LAGGNSTIMFLRNIVFSGWAACWLMKCKILQFLAQNFLFSYVWGSHHIFWQLSKLHTSQAAIFWHTWNNVFVLFGCYSSVNAVVSLIKPISPTSISKKFGYSWMSSNVQDLLLWVCTIYGSITCTWFLKLCSRSSFQLCHRWTCQWSSLLGERSTLNITSFNGFTVFTLIFSVDIGSPTTIPVWFVFQYVHQLVL